jgi:heptosyltransferase-1
LKILIVKLSSLGDVVHAMPAVQDLRQAWPQAQIDWVVEPAFAPLLRRCSGVQRVIACDLRRWRRAPLSAATRQAWREFRAELQAEAYDRVIDLQGLSKSALVAWLARLAPGGRRVALGNRSDGSSYEAPTRWVADQVMQLPPHIGAVARSRALCAQALGYALPEILSFGLASRVPLESGAMENEAGLRLGPKVVVLAHGSSRADKLWPVAAWQALGQRLLAQGYTLALPHGSEAELQQAQAIAQPLAGAQIWPRLGLDALTDALAACAGVIGVDSGLSHIAVALDLPHVQLYNFDTAWRTGPAPGPRQCSVLGTPQPTLDQVWQAWETVRPVVGSAVFPVAAPA